ncbi:MAG: co-chaperone GroES [Phycisphaerae bacterium]|nr:co-chaperone GroES [Phycisphaerae bacterium]
MKVKPLNDKILVKRVEASTQTDSGIFLPESAAEKPQQAKVIETGDGKLNDKTGKRVDLQVKKGQTVLLSKWGGTEVKVGGDEMLIVNEDDILGVVD